MNTVYEAFAVTAEAAPEHAFLCAPPAANRAYHPDGVEYTYAQVRAEVERLRGEYETAGYGHGHRVALLLENRPEFFFHYLALNALGCGIVPINPDYRHDGAPEGLHPDEPLLPELRRLVSGHGRPRRDRIRPRPHPQPPAALPHEQPGPDGNVRDAHGELPDPARALQSHPLVAGRGGQSRDDRPLPRCGAADAAEPGGRAAGASARGEVRCGRR